MINFLTNLNLQEYILTFQSEEINDLETLKELTENDLKELGLKLGQRKKILKALSESTQDLSVEITASSNNSIVYPNKLNPKDMVTYLAHPWDEYIREDHPSVKLHWLVDTAEVAVRWICALLLAEIRYANNNNLPDTLQKKFKENIARPTLGLWLIFVKELSWEKPEQTHLNGLFDIYSNELEKDGFFPKGGDDKTSLLKLRNRIAHGGGTTRTQAKEYLDIYDPHLESLLLSVNNIMHHAKLYGNLNDTCYLLQGLESIPEECSTNIEGPYIKTGDTILSLWPLVEFDMVRQLDDNGILEEKTELTPQTYLRTDKQGVQYIPMGVEESYSISNKQEEFETIFGLNIKTEKSAKMKRYEYQHDDFLREAKCLREELIGRVDEIKTMKKWIKTVDVFDNTLSCKYIYGGPGIGKSRLMASVAFDLSDDNKNHIFYYRFRGGDARNNKETFIKLLRDSLISWSPLREKCEEAENLTSTDDMLKDLEIRMDKIKGLAPFTKKVSKTEKIEVRPILRLFIDGLDEVLAQDRSVLRLIESFQKQGIATLIATRLENGAEELAESSWSQALEFRDDIDGLPPMSDNDIRGMLLDGISKTQRKELIENDSDTEESLSNPIVHAISQKADGLPLYIHLLINDLQNGKYSLGDINKLPDGLTKYYHKLVTRGGMTDINSYKAPLITLLGLTSEPIDTQAIALILDDIEDAEDTEALIKDVILAVGTLLKQVTTKEETTGYTLYHQSFRDFISKAEDDEKHPLHRNVTKTKKLLCKRAKHWRELPSSNLKNHLFRSASAYILDWQKDGLEIVKNRLTDLEYLLQRTEQLSAAELENLLKEYELVQSLLPKEQQKEFYIWSSFFREKLHLIARVDEEKWQPSQSLFQLAYEDGDNSPLTKQAEQLLEKNKIDFVWMKKKNRVASYQRSGLVRKFTNLQGDVYGLLKLIKQDDVFILTKINNQITKWNLEGKRLGQWNDDILNNETICEFIDYKERSKIIHLSEIELCNGKSFFHDKKYIGIRSKMNSIEWEKDVSDEHQAGDIYSLLELKNGNLLTISYMSSKKDYLKKNTAIMWNKKGDLITSLLHSNPIVGIIVLDDQRFLTFDDDTMCIWNNDGEKLGTSKTYGSDIFLLDNGKILLRNGLLFDNNLEYNSSLNIQISSLVEVDTNRIIINSDGVLSLWDFNKSLVQSRDSYLKKTWLNNETIIGYHDVKTTFHTDEMNIQIDNHSVKTDIKWLNNNFNIKYTENFFIIYGYDITYDTTMPAILGLDIYIVNEQGDIVKKFYQSLYSSTTETMIKTFGDEFIIKNKNTSYFKYFHPESDLIDCKEEIEKYSLNQVKDFYITKSNIITLHQTNEEMPQTVIWSKTLKILKIYEGLNLDHPLELNCQEWCSYLGNELFFWSLYEVKSFVIEYRINAIVHLGNRKLIVYSDYDVSLCIDGQIEKTIKLVTKIDQVKQYNNSIVVLHEHCFTVYNENLIKINVYESLNKQIVLLTFDDSGVNIWNQEYKNMAYCMPSDGKIVDYDLSKGLFLIYQNGKASIYDLQYKNRKITDQYDLICLSEVIEPSAWGDHY